MGAKQIATLFAAVAASAFGAFVYFGIQADVAMDKSGAGDLRLFTHYSQLAGGCFWAVVVSWAGSVLSAQLSPTPFRGRALFWLGLVQPVLYGTAYVVVLVVAT
jgi:hypothetical protein